MKAGHAGTLDPFATGLLIVLLGRAATREQARFMGAAQDLPRTAPLRRGLDDGRPGGRDHRDRGRARTSSSCRPARSASGRRRTRRSRSAASAPTSGRAGARSSRCPSAMSTVHRFELTRARRRRGRVRDRVLVGHLRAQPDRRPRRRLLQQPAADRDRPVLESRRPTSRPLPLADALARASAPDRVPRAMSIEVTPLPDAEPRPREIAIGTFDGVHVGHRKVIGGADTVLTFEPHPLSVIHPEAAPKLIMPFDIKRDVIEGLGVEELVIIPFDKELLDDRGRGVLLADPDRDARRRAGRRSARTSASARRPRATHIFSHRRGVRDTRRAARRGRPLSCVRCVGLWRCMARCCWLRASEWRGDSRPGTTECE